MSEEAVDIYLTGLPKSKRDLLMDYAIPVAIEITRRCNPEYLKQKCQVMIKESEKIWDKES